MIRIHLIRPKNKKENGKKADDESTEDYQLSRAFDLILALNLINLKTTQ